MERGETNYCLIQECFYILLWSVFLHLFVYTHTHTYYIYWQHIQPQKVGRPFTLHVFYTRFLFTYVHVMEAPSAVTASLSWSCQFQCGHCDVPVVKIFSKKMVLNLPILHKRDECNFEDRWQIFLMSTAAAAAFRLCIDALFSFLLRRVFVNL